MRSASANRWHAIHTFASQRAAICTLSLRETLTLLEHARPCCEGGRLRCEGGPPMPVESSGPPMLVE